MRSIEFQASAYMMLFNKGDDEMKRKQCAIGIHCSYELYQAPLTGVRSIPESAFTGRSNILFGMNMKRWKAMPLLIIL